MFLINNEIKELPLDVYSVSERNRWALLPYNQHINLLDCLDLYKLHDKYEGFTIFFNYKIFVFYDSEVSEERIRFTLAHEFGHILLFHISEVSPANYEQEANMFANRILMPLCVLKECKAFSAEKIAKLCGTTVTASENRLKRLNKIMERNKFYLSPLENRVLEQFKEFIDKNKYNE